MARKLQALLTALLFVSSSVSAQWGPTGLTGFYDYQTHGRTPKHLSVNPANGHLHAIFTSSFDSVLISQARRTYYAYSTNGGWTWNKFGNIQIPFGRSRFASLTVGQGPIQGASVIVNQCSLPSGDSVLVHVDFPEGWGAFGSLVAVPLRADPPYSPDVACSIDGSTTVLGVLPGSQTLAVSRTTDYVVWSPPRAIPGSSAINDRYLIESNSNGRVGVVFDGGTQGLLLWESTNNGETWSPLPPTQILPPVIVAGPDSFTLGFGLDFLYYGNDPLVVFGLKQINAASDSAGIGFWTRTTGFVLAVPHHRIYRLAHRLNKPQIYQYTVGYPAISIDSYQYVHVAFQAFQPETSARGYNYSNLYVTVAHYGSTTWSSPQRVNYTATLDERYPSSANWNAFGNIPVVYQQDPEPGCAVTGEQTPLRRVVQQFINYGIIENVEEEKPSGYALLQNYPNPFNPVTNVQFTIPVGTYGHTSLRVYDVLGREVATLVDEEKPAGTYEVTWNANAVSSGVYYYRLSVAPVGRQGLGAFTDVKKLIHVK